MIGQVNTDKLKSVRSDLLTVCAMSDALQTDKDFLRQVEEELVKRDAL